MDLYYRFDNRIYLRIAGVYYVRIAGVGWKLLPESEAPEESKFWPLHDQQREAYLPALKEAGLVKSVE